MYVRSTGRGSRIAINERLTLRWQAWVLAHELGHHFRIKQSELFSAFVMAAHKVNIASRRRWGMWRTQDPLEEMANKWAAETLISDQDWRNAEAGHPCDLNAILHELDLPRPAAIARERSRRSSSSVETGEVIVSLSDRQSQVLSRSVTGQGGHQTFFRRVVDDNDPTKLR